MIVKLIRRMFIAQVMASLTVTICAVIDNIITGQFLGVTALAACGLANPVILAIFAVTTLLSDGVRVTGGRFLGNGSQDDMDSVFSSSIAISVIISVTFCVLVIIFRVPLAVLLGASGDTLINQTSDYILGYVIGTPAFMCSLVLIAFLEFAGQSGLIVAATLGLTVSGVASDLLNVYIFHGGMFGMGLASAVSYYIALIITCSYFFSKQSIFKFSFAAVKLRKIRECIVGGAPTVYDLIFGLLLVFIMNYFLMAHGGDMLVAVFAVVNTIGTLSKSVSLGASGVSLTLSGVFYYEENRVELRRLLREIIRVSTAAGALVGILVSLFASSIARLFIPETGFVHQTAVFALRCFSLGMIPCCLNCVLKSCYQGTQRVTRMEVISLLQNLILPAAAAWFVIKISYVSGVWYYFLIGEVLTLLGVMISIWINKRRVTLRAEDVLLLRDDFGVPSSDVLEVNIHDIKDAMDASHAAETFCRAHGGSDRLASHMALCFEEMSTNVLTHGFLNNGHNSLSVLLQCKQGLWTLRFRDDCSPFDPVRYLLKLGAEDLNEPVGIRLALKMADSAHYTYSMNLNNLALYLRDDYV